MNRNATLPRGGVRPPHRRRIWLAAGVVVLATVVVGIAISAVLGDRGGVSTASAFATSSTTPSARPSPTPTPSSAAPIPSQGPTALATPSPEPTIAPRAAWSVVLQDGFVDVGRLDGVTEVGGRLFALGSDTGAQPMLWFTDDGVTWTPAEIPDLPAESELGGQVKALVETDTGLAAVAALGYREGSGYFGTAMYTSRDRGLSWQMAESTPGLTEGALFDIALSGSRLIAVGSTVWISDDSGRTWMTLPGGTTLDGTMLSVDTAGELLLAAGMRGADVTGPPAIAWISRDSAETWQRTVLNADGGATGAAVTASGRLLITGYQAVSSTTSFLWSSDDGGSSWAELELEGSDCCPRGVVETPSGVVIGFGSAEPYGVLGSIDGVSWTFEEVGFRLREIAWGDEFGLVGISDDNEVVLGPVPYP
jgi:hypothetical protein